MHADTAASSKTKKLMECGGIVKFSASMRAPSICSVFTSNFPFNVMPVDNNYFRDIAEIRG